MAAVGAPIITRFEVDDSHWGREYGELRVFVRFPGYVGGAADNARIWDLIEDLQAAHPEWNTKDGYLHGHVNGCATDEILATKRLR